MQTIARTRRYLRFPSQIKQNSLRTGDTVEGEMRAPRETERYFAITKIDKINFEEIQKTKQRINFDNLTPLPRGSIKYGNK